MSRTRPISRPPAQLSFSKSVDAAVRGRLPQLEGGYHGATVVGMFFFDDNTFVLREGDPVRERLGRVAAEHGMLLMLCDQCALERHLAEGEIGSALPKGTVAGVRVGCFPDLYAALAGNPPDQVITL